MRITLHSRSTIQIQNQTVTVAFTVTVSVYSTGMYKDKDNLYYSYRYRYTVLRNSDFPCTFTCACHYTLFQRKNLIEFDSERYCDLGVDWAAPSWRESSGLIFGFDKRVDKDGCCLTRLVVIITIIYANWIHIGCTLVPMMLPKKFPSQPNDLLNQQLVPMPTMMQNIKEQFDQICKKRKYDQI